MNAERFETLASAYGADLDRWPMGERAAAMAFLEGNAQARAILDEEAALDAALDRMTVSAPSGVLRERILALAPRMRQPIWRRTGAWASGAGLAAACVLGILFGANMSSAVLADPATDTVVEASTAFNGTGYFDALETAG